MILKKEILKKLFAHGFVLGLMILCYSCTEQKPDENLRNAFDLHNEALDMRKKVKDHLTQLRQNEDSVFLSHYGSTLDSLSLLAEAWDEQIIEVPGFEHKDDHSHDHDHDHDHHGHDHVEDLNLAPEEHLEIQQELKDEIFAIEKALSKIPK